MQTMRIIITGGTILLVVALTGCRSKEGEPCYKDEMCAEGLTCKDRYCEPAGQVEARKLSERSEQEAVAGFKRLVQACQTAYEAYEKFEKENERLAAMAQKQAGLKAGQEATVEVDQGVEQLLLEYAIASENTLQEATRIGVPLYDDNPFFREAVRKTLRATLAEGQPGPAVSFEIEFCDPAFLETLWIHIGEPEMPGL